MAATQRARRTMDLHRITPTLDPMRRRILALNHNSPITLLVFILLVLQSHPNRVIPTQDTHPTRINPGRQPMFLEVPRRNRRTMELVIRDHRTTALRAHQVALLVHIREGFLPFPPALQAPHILSNPTTRPNMDGKPPQELRVQSVDPNRAITRRDILLIRINPGRRLMHLEAPRLNSHTTEQPTKGRRITTPQADQVALRVRTKEVHRPVLLEHRVLSSLTTRLTPSRP